MTTPEERLAARAWRLRHSLWTLWSLLPAFGLFTFLGFFLIGVRAKNRRWMGYALGWFGYAVFLATAMSLTDPGGDEPTGDPNPILPLLYFVIWIAGIVHTFRVNRAYLTWRARYARVPWHQAMPHPAPPPSAPAFPPPPATAPAKISAATRYRALPIDLNTAPAPRLQQELGLSRAAAEAIVAARDRIGRFSSPDQLRTQLALPPTLVLAVRERVVTGRAHAPGAERRPHGSH